MTEAEVQDLLTFVAGYDGRGFAPGALELWADSLDCAWVPNLSLDEARAAVIAHCQRTPVRVTPADVLRIVRDDRMAAVRFPGMPRGGTPPNEAYRAARAELDALNAARKANR